MGRAESGGRGPQSYSEKRRTEDFSIYVLLSEPVRFTTGEILAALREDYPGLSWTDDLQLNAPVDTAALGVGVMWARKDQTREPAMISFIATPGRCDIDWADVTRKSRFAFPQAAQAIAGHVSALMISVKAHDTSLEARFDAARRMTCVGALFARLPVCTAVYYPGADLVLAPAFWVEAAATAVRGEVPYFQWLNVVPATVPDGRDPVPVTAHSCGLAAFLGCEVAVILARMPPVEAVKHVFAACEMLLERGHRFRDSDTIGREGSPEKFRIRFLGEGVQGMQTDVWALLHPTFPLDEEKLFGPRLLRPAPAGVDNSLRGDAGWLKKRLYGFFARAG